MASTEYKGITINIGANTEQLTTALKNIDKSIKNTSYELNQVNKLLKLDPTNTELLAQKQQLLAAAIDETKNKLNKLRDAQSQLDKSGVDKNSEQYRLLQREIAKSEQALKDYNDQTEEASKKTSTFGDVLKANLTAEAITKGLKTIAEGIKSVVSGYVDLISSGVEYNAKMETYQKSFENMLGSYEEAASTMESIANASKTSSFGVEALVKANQLLISTGESAEESQKVIMALGDAIAYTGGDDDALTRMAQNLQQIKNVGKATSTDIKQFAMAGIDVYGILAESMGKSVEEIKDMDISYNDLEKALIKASSEGGKYFNAMNSQTKTFNGQMNLLNSNFAEFTGVLATDTTNALTNGLLPAINETITAMTTGMKENGTQGMIDAMKEGIIKIAGIVTKEMPAIIDMGIDILIGVADGIISAIPNLVPVIEMLCVKLTEFITANIPLLIEGGIQIVLALAKGLVKAIPTLIKSLPEIVAAIVKGLAEALPEIFTIGVDLVKGLWEGIKSVGDWIKQKLSEFANTIVGGLKDLFGIHSPSRVMKNTIGKNLALGIGEGFTKEIPSIAAKMENALSGLTGQVNASVNPTINTSANTNPLILQIENFNNTRETDIQALAEELEFYRKNSALAYGGQ